jgi:hypothetical protein
MKRVIVGVLEFLLFLIVFLVGSLLPGANKMAYWQLDLGSGRTFVYNGLVLMLVVYGLFLLVAVLRKRIRLAWPVSTAAVALALVAGLLMKFGFKGN